MKTILFFFFIGLAVLQSLLIFIGTHKMNIEGLTPAVLIRFVMLIVILMVTYRSIRLTRIHENRTESRLFRILNYVSLICSFLFSPLSGVLMSLAYFYFSDWPMNISAQNAGMGAWFIPVQMLVFLIVPIFTITIARTKWNLKKTNGNRT